MKTNTYLLASAVIFTIVALVHLLRFVEGWPVLLGTTMVPMWASLLALLVCAAIAIWGFSLLARR